MHDILEFICLITIFWLVIRLFVKLGDTDEDPTEDFFQ